MITLAVGITACGGDVFDRGSGGSAGSGAGGASGTAGSMGAGGSDPGCPTALPVNGTTCAGSRACDYPFCGSSAGQTATCVAGKWQVAPKGSCNPPPPRCPSALPQASTACYPATEGMSCEYAGKPCCPPDTATCMSGQWRVPIVDCNPPPPLPCPVNPPVSGTPCASDSCAFAPTECSYGDCSQGSRFVMRCDGGVWRTEPTACPGQPCAGLDFCACFARADCQYLTDSCICPCDYHCPGQPDCVCGCGGGNYLGCAPR